MLFSIREPYVGAGAHRRLLLPAEYRQQAFQQAHEEVGHSSVRKTLDALRDSVVWPGMRSYVTEQILTCVLSAIL